MSKSEKPGDQHGAREHLSSLGGVGGKPPGGRRSERVLCRKLRLQSLGDPEVTKKGQAKSKQPQDPGPLTP